MAYVVGIDLGTTHSALAYVDLDLSEGETVALHTLELPQSVEPGAVAEKALLPSFLYLPHAGELPEGATALPWGAPTHLVGELARTLGAKTPIRSVHSAKSWLGHANVDRRGPILPPKMLDDAGDIARISPLDASVAYLTHLREAWNAANPGEPLAEQELVITVPASFDPAARELTAEAAERAGLGHAVLLEEPQAALYSWIEKSGGAWRKDVKVGDVILVVDIGGGTSDFSLIAVLESQGELELRRIAVGDHILLGGDNMDLALAMTLRARLEAEGKSLDAFQQAALVAASRRAKEELLATDAPAQVSLTLPSRGSKLIGGSLRIDVTRDEVEAALVEGFFPLTSIDDAPRARARGALRELGLPYASDAAITRHLAAFLKKQRDATRDLPGFVAGGTFVHPTAILMNGGVLKAPALEARIVQAITSWLAADGAAPARVLGGADLDLAVARGAAYYAYARRGQGVRIRGGTAKSYYVGIESAMPAVPGLPPPVSALCISPFGLEEGTAARPAPQELGLVVGEPVEFRFFESAVRREDAPGTMVERWEGQLTELPPVSATLTSATRKEGELVPVRLEASVTEVGTLRVDAVSQGGERWKVELDVR